jgi:hypothetical protein
VSGPLHWKRGSYVEVRSLIRWRTTREIRHYMTGKSNRPTLLRLKVKLSVHALVMTDRDYRHHQSHFNPDPGQGLLTRLAYSRYVCSNIRSNPISLCNCDVLAHGKCRGGIGEHFANTPAVGRRLAM